MYLFIDSKQSDVCICENSCTCFTVVLPDSVKYDDSWEVCLKEMRLKKVKASTGSPRGYFLISSDIAQSSSTYGRQANVLRTFEIVKNKRLVENYHYPEGYYFPVTGASTGFLNFSVSTLDGVEVGFERVWLVLHLRPRRT